MALIKTKNNKHIVTLDEIGNHSDKVKRMPTSVMDASFFQHMRNGVTCKNKWGDQWLESSRKCSIINLGHATMRIIGK
jgi:hypothetical protein